MSKPDNANATESPPRAAVSRKDIPWQTMYMLGSLLGSFLVVDFFYRAVVRPNVRRIMAAVEAGQVSGEETSIWIILRDFEQQACLTLFLWACALIVWKWWQAARERRVLDAEPLQLGEADAISANRANHYMEMVRKAVSRRELGLILPRALLRGLARFRKGSTVEEVSSSVSSLCEGELARMESELSMINYIAWAIPSVGFIGTVRGIGSALAVAGSALGDDISIVTDRLGTAFNSTLIALLLSIPLMLLIHQIRQRQEETIAEIERYCEENLVSRLYRKPPEAASQG